VNRVLVTGSSGALGRAVTAHLRAEGLDTVGLDRAPGADFFGPVTPDLVRRALDGVDAVIHLAAIPAPSLGTPVEVFGGNSLATFTVLDAAAEAGVRRAVIASSLSVLGLAFAPKPPVDPAYLPIDEATPLQVADPYALGKQADEATGAMMARRHALGGLSVVALRFPRLGGVDDRLADTAAEWREDPAKGAREFWAYLDYRDAARAVRLGLDQPAGYHLCQVAAPETLAARPTDELLDRFYPRVPRRRAFPGWSVPFDLRHAVEVLGFEAVHHYEPERAC
jgi:nucleoside-diphosphate-sugar epimerase